MAATPVGHPRGDRSNVARDGTILPGNVRSQVNENLIDVAPSPTLRRVIALHDGMLCRVKMLRGVLSRRLVTATDMPAGSTNPQMHPFLADFQAFLASAGAGMHLFNTCRMRTALVQEVSPPTSIEAGHSPPHTQEQFHRVDFANGHST
jgi:hypothetical protein